MVIKLSTTDNKKNPFFELILFLYFIFIFAHGAVPYVKFGLWLLLVCYAVYNCVRPATKTARKQLFSGLLWIGPFCAWVALSTLWTTINVTTGEETTNQTMLRIFFVVVVIFSYCTTKEKCMRVLHIFLFTSTYTILVAMLTSPLSTYGTTAFQGVVVSHRNGIGALGSISAFLAFYFYRHYRKIWSYLFCCVICTLGVLATGSRGALLSMVFMLGLYVLLSGNFQTRLVRVGIFLSLAIVGMILIFNVPFLREAFGERMLAIFSDKYEDSSAADRSFYVEVGWEMLRQKPLFGWGQNSFSFYIDRFTDYGRRVYSHNNYIELLCNYGIVGLACYYWQHLRLLIQTVPRRKTAEGRLLLILLLRFLVFDWQSVPYLQYYTMFFLAIMFAFGTVLKNEQATVPTEEQIPLSAGENRSRASRI